MGKFSQTWSRLILSHFSRFLAFVSYFSPIKIYFVFWKSKYCMFTGEYRMLGKDRKPQDQTFDTLLFRFCFCLLTVLLCVTEEAWFWGPFQEKKPSSSPPFVSSVVNAADLSVGGEARSPGVLPGGRKRCRNCPAHP